MKKRNIACVLTLSIVIIIFGTCLMQTCKKITTNKINTQIVEEE